MKFILAVSLFLSALTPGLLFAGEIEDACTDLVLDYAFYRDRPDAQAYANIFAHDGELSVMGQNVVGRKAIYERLAAGGDTTPVFRHMMSTIRISVTDDDHATGVSYVTVYAGEGEKLPTTTSQFAAIGEYHDDFVRTDEGWKIAKRVFVPVFLPPQ